MCLCVVAERKYGEVKSGIAFLSAYRLHNSALTVFMYKQTRLLRTNTCIRDLHKRLYVSETHNDFFAESRASMFPSNSHKNTLVVQRQVKTDEPIKRRLDHVRPRPDVGERSVVTVNDGITGVYRGECYQRIAKKKTL